MASTAIYLNFKDQTEEAFNFYKSVFGGEFEGKVARFSEVPPSPDIPCPSKQDGNLIMHVCLPILGGTRLMGTDAPESMGFKIIPGNNIYISLHPDTKAETDKLFKGLSDGGKVEQPLQEMFWGDYYGSVVDRFGVKWMFNCTEK